jgi:hypothetical protein
VPIEVLDCCSDQEKSNDSGENGDGGTLNSSNEDTEEDSVG